MSVVSWLVSGSSIGDELRSGILVPVVQAFAKAHVLVGLLLGQRVLMNCFIEFFFALIIIFFFIFFFLPGFFIGIAVDTSFSGLASGTGSSCCSYRFPAFLGPPWLCWL